MYIPANRNPTTVEALRQLLDKKKSSIFLQEVDQNIQNCQYCLKYGFNIVNLSLILIVVYEEVSWDICFGYYSHLPTKIWN